MDIVDEFVERVVVGLLERNDVQVLSGNQEADDEAQERIEELKVRRALLSDLLGIPGHEGGLDREQFLRQNSVLNQQLEAEEARLRMAQPDEALMSFTGAGAGKAWTDADVVRKRAVLKALERMVGFTVSIDRVGPGRFSDKSTSKYEGIRGKSDLVRS